ncbi:MAG TPA: uridine kinase [Vicinamibacteria bacterium]
MIAIGVAGGTASGKTSFARAVAARVGPEKVALLSQDAYYHDPSHLPMEERARINYDHPRAYDSELLTSHLDALKRGESVPRLAYDFVAHARVLLEGKVEPRPILLLEGILILEDQRLRDRLEIKIFMDTDADVRVLRRLRRDIEERGRTLESVSRQYLQTVRPMHLEFTEPSKRYADLIVPQGARNEVALDLVTARVLELLLR